MLQQYNRFVKPAYDDFIKPTMKFADVIVPFWDRNENAIEMLVENLKIKLSKFKIGQQRLQMGISSDDLLSPATNEIKRALLSSGQPKPGLSLPSQEIQDKAEKIISLTQKLIDSNTLDADEI